MSALGRTVFNSGVGIGADDPGDRECDLRGVCVSITALPAEKVLMAIRRKRAAE